MSFYSILFQDMCPCLLLRDQYSALIVSSNVWPLDMDMLFVYMSQRYGLHVLQRILDEINI